MTPLPTPDTHCFDDDTGADCWSHSPAQMQAYGKACREAALGQAAKAIVEPIGHDDYTAMRQAAEKIRSLK